MTTTTTPRLLKSSTSSSSSFLRLLLFFLCSYPCVVECTITLTATGQHFESRPDARVGTRFLQGFEYLARLQVFDHDDRSLNDLCSSYDDRGHPLNLTVDVPPDGLPVAILARNTGCSVETKARIVSHTVSPSHVVKYLILYGGDNKFDFFDDNDNDDERMRLVFHHNNKIVDRQRYDIDVSVGVLHVSERSGNELLWTISNQSEQTKTAGGPRLLLDGRDAAKSRLARDLTLWMGIGVLMMACLFSFFLSVRAQQGALFRSEAINAENGTAAAAARRTLRRLTVEQVQELVPEYTASDYVCLEMDQACSICLDEYDAADKCRELPCGHVFHSDCILKWLTERSSVCPLCKTDLLCEYDDDDDDPAIVSDSDNDDDDSGSVNLGVFGIMDRVFARRWWRRRQRSQSLLETTTNRHEQEMISDNAHRQEHLQQEDDGVVSRMPLLENDYEGGSDRVVVDGDGDDEGVNRV